MGGEMDWRGDVLRAGGEVIWLGDTLGDGR